MIIKCVVACTNANGDPDFYFCKVECKQYERDQAVHYQIAYAAAAKNGYEDDMVGFAEDDGHAWLFDHFVWDSASVFTTAILGT